MDAARFWVQHEWRCCLVARSKRPCGKCSPSASVRPACPVSYVASGNVESTITSTLFWVDSIAPSSVLLNVAPDPVSTAKVAQYEFQAPQGQNSAGQLRLGACFLPRSAQDASSLRGPERFQALLLMMRSSESRWLSVLCALGGWCLCTVYNLSSVPAASMELPDLPPPTPTNDAAVSLSLPGLETSVTYTLTVWAVSQGEMMPADPIAIGVCHGFQSVFLQCFPLS